MDAPSPSTPWPADRSGAAARPESATSRAVPPWRLSLGGHDAVVWFKPNPRARFYRLTLQRDGSFRCTIPRRGSLDHARDFVRRHQPWMESRLVRRSLRPMPHLEWRLGMPVWFRGIPTPIIRDPAGPHLLLGDLVIPQAAPDVHDLRPRMEVALRALAVRELPPRVLELASLHGYVPRIIQVRNQRARWGSCSARGRISLNWRLVQVPTDVRDYIILHELAHLRHLNHSPRFWDEVRRICPAFEAAEAWIKAHGHLVL